MIFQIKLDCLGYKTMYRYIGEKGLSCLLFFINFCIIFNGMLGRDNVITKLCEGPVHCTRGIRRQNQLYPHYIKNLF